MIVGRGVRGLLLAALTLLAPAVPARTLPPIYPPEELAHWQGRYPDGVTANLESVIQPALTAAERSALAGARLRFPAIVPVAEPFAFYAERRADGTPVITLSTASIKLLDDLAVAQAWLQLRGYSQETVYEYMHWLRYGPDASARAVPPLDALCVPGDALDDAAVDQLAQRLLRGQIFFILAHELGHVLHGHPGYDGVARSVARANEAEADAFALDVFTRVGEPPLALPAFFMLTAYAEPGRGDFETAEAYHAHRSRRTHPVSAARLRAVAEHVRASAGAYRETLPGRDAVAVYRQLADAVTGIADTLEDPEMQVFLAGRGRRVTLSDLAPRRPGERLGPSCQGDAGARGAGGEPFSGLLDGRLLTASETFPASVELRRTGERVDGRFDFGAGVGQLSGRVTGGRLTFVWRVGATGGRGVLWQDDIGHYEGTWGYGEAPAGGGRWALAPRAP